MTHHRSQVIGKVRESIAAAPRCIPVRNAQAPPSERRSFTRYGQGWERREARLGVDALDSWERRGAFPWSGWPCRVAGAVVDVLRDELFSAYRGGGARCDGRPISVSSCASLPEALVTTGFSYRAELRDVQGEVAHRLLSRARDLRCFGSTALELCWVACARVDGYFQRDTEIWDRAAGALIAEEAGARTEMPCPENDDLVLAACPAVFEDLRAVVHPVAA